MTSKQKQHIEKIMGDFCQQAYLKYDVGAKEHGGNLWDKKQVIDFAIEEAIDQVIYLFTLKEQLDSGKYYELTGEDKA